MNKDYAKSIGKLTALKKCVRGIKKELKQLHTTEEILEYLTQVREIIMEKGSREDANWIIAYATELEKL